ncbi:2-dehydropantoate 2-reductase [Comamonas thiooxydans]|uniref:2-dehydropantoate 2-reductase n=1 Tax=Comamonas thiooxydans TaxID=363952 RepID=UPI00209BDC27|nr:2-dehydropantoate 2-reductase [Comamonas thiooxydans]MCO8249186.1 2-dehydropantoate 2-reductase [Comamonas thiooxydans]
MGLKRVCIYGAGAIGGWLGVALAKAGFELSAVARGQTLAALQHNGLTLVHGEERETVAVNAQQDPAALGVQDVVVIAVKAPSMPDVARAVAPLIGPQTLVLTAMNGVPWWFLAGGVDAGLRGLQLRTVDPQGEIARAIPTGQVLGSVVHASCSLDAPGVVRRHFGNSLIVGEPTALPGDAPTPRLLALAELLRAGGIELRLSDNIQRDAWYKLWGNMTMNPVSAITGATTDRILGDELVRNFITAVMLEAREIGARIGLPIADSPQDRHQVTLKLGGFKTSMLQDVEAGKPVELDALVGAVREMGAMCGMTTPFTDALLGLTRLRAQQLGLYPV